MLDGLDGLCFIIRTPLDVSNIHLFKKGFSGAFSFAFQGAPAVGRQTTGHHPHKLPRILHNYAVMRA
jgi:hypothetical protein